MSPESVKDVFRVLDVDGSGFIEEDELKWDPYADRPAPGGTNSPLHALVFLVWSTGTFSRAFPRREEISQTMRRKRSSKLQTKMETARSELMVREELCANLCWINTRTALKFVQLCFILCRVWDHGAWVRIPERLHSSSSSSSSLHSRVITNRPPPHPLQPFLSTHGVWPGHATQYPGAGHQRVNHEEKHTASFFKIHV